MSNIVPFGKYKDQPVEALLADTQYCQWLMAQAWFADRYSELLDRMTTGGKVPTETPEHNRMVAQFTDPEFRIYFMLALYPDAESDPLVDVVAYEDCGWDIVLDARNWSTPPVCVECKPTLGDDFPAVLRQLKRQRDAYALQRNRGYVGHVMSAVFVEQFTAVGATREQVSGMFSLSGFRFIVA